MQQSDEWSVQVAEKDLISPPPRFKCIPNAARKTASLPSPGQRHTFTPRLISFETLAFEEKTVHSSSVGREKK